MHTGSHCSVTHSGLKADLKQLFCCVYVLFFLYCVFVTKY